MASWQLKGLLLLASALVASALAASTAGAISAPSAKAVSNPCSIAAAARPQDATISKPTSCWHG